MVPVESGDLGERRGFIDDGNSIMHLAGTVRRDAVCNAEIWTNCLLSNGKNKVGAPGCVGTVPRFRRKGIGLKMVAMACEELKKQGCDTCFIHYTGVGHWYAKLGFQTFLTWYFCKKRLT